MQEDLSPGKSYHLKWSGHGACLADQFEGPVSEYTKSEVFTDVTIIAGLDLKTSVVRSHRILLSASSDYFLQLLRDSSSDSPTVVLPDVSATTLRDLIAFVQTGEVHVTEEHLDPLLEAAKMLQVRGLTDTNNDDDLHPKRRSPSESAVLSPKRKRFSSDDYEQDQPLDYRSSPSEQQPPRPPPGQIEEQVEEALPLPPTPGSPPLTPMNHEDLSRVSNGVINVDGVDDGAIMRPEESAQSTSASGMNLVNTATAAEDVARIMSQVTSSHNASPPACPICSREFSSANALRIHLQTTHVSTDRPFACDLCAARFARASHLSRHRRTHTGEKPFECTRCGKAFSRQDKLKTHTDRHLIKEGILPPFTTSKPKKKKSKKTSPPPPPSSSGGMQPHPHPPTAAAAGSSGSSVMPTVASVQEAQDAANRASWNNCAFPGLNPYIQQQVQQGQHFLTPQQPPTGMALQNPATQMFPPMAMPSGSAVGNAAIVASLVKMVNGGAQQY